MTTLNRFIKYTSIRLIEEFPGYWNPEDYQHNKSMLDGMHPEMTKSLRNTIAGRITHALNNGFFLGVKTKKLRGGSRKKKGRRR